MGQYSLLDLQISLFRGVAEDIDMPVQAKNPAGIIMPGDEIFSALEWDTEGTIATLADVTDNVSVSRAGYITNDTAPTSDVWQGMLFWNRLNGGNKVLGNPCYKQILVAGGNAAADLTATGLAVGDTILAVFHLSTAAQISTIGDVTHQCTHAAADKLNCSIATNNDHLWVWYHDANGTGIENPNLKFTLCDGNATEITVTGITTDDTLITGTHITEKTAVASLSNAITYVIADDNDVTVSATSADDQHIIVWHDAG